MSPKTTTRIALVLLACSSAVQCGQPNVPIPNSKTKVAAPDVKEKKSMEFRQLDDRYAVAGPLAYVFVAPPTNMMMGPQHFANRDNWQEISEADGLTLKVLGKGYARDMKHGYFAGVPLSGSDSATLDVLGDFYARDKSRVYCGADVVPDADPFSFQTDLKFGSGYGWDSQHVYWSRGFQGVEKTAASVGSFEVLDLTHSRDAHAVYIGATATKADPKTFVVLNGYFTKDAKTVFFADEASAADPSSFALVPFKPEGVRTASFGHDATKVYYLGTEIPKADPTTFVDLGGHYAKDNHAVYFRAQILADADLATFEPISPSVFFDGQGNAVAQDVSHYYATHAMGPHRWPKTTAP